MTALALDLARQTGWAAGKPAALPTFGTISLDAPSESGRFLQLSRHVSLLIKRFEAKEVIFERPFAGSRPNALMPLFGMRAVVMASAKALGIEPTSIEPSVWRKHFIGHGGGKRDAAKAAVLAKCRWRGWDPANNDEADALGLLDWRLACLDERHLVMGMTPSVHLGD